MIKAISFALSPIQTQGRSIRFEQGKGGSGNRQLNSDATLAANDCAIDWYFFLREKAKDATKGCAGDLKAIFCRASNTKGFS